MRECRDHARALDAKLSAALLQVAQRNIDPQTPGINPLDAGLTGVLSALVTADLPGAFVRDQADTYHWRLRTDLGFGALVALQGFPHDVLTCAEELNKLAEDTLHASPAFKNKFEEFLDLDYESLPANTVSASNRLQTGWKRDVLEWHRKQGARGARSGTQRRRRTLEVVGTALTAVQSLLDDTALPLHVREAVRAICPTEHKPAQAREAMTGRVCGVGTAEEIAERGQRAVQGARVLSTS